MYSVTKVDDIRKEFMPHGALMLFDGDRHVATRFRYWSPENIPFLSLSGQLFEMHDCGTASGETGRAGWSELTLPAGMAPAGTEYAYGFEGNDGLKLTPDIASFALKGSTDGPSIVTDLRHTWNAPDWKGLPWHKAHVLSVHIGTDTRDGTFLSMIDELDGIKARGFNTIEPLNFGAFAGSRGWGFDCVQPMAPHVPYGSLQDLMTLIDACHERGMAFSTQLIQNHLGALGNYIKPYAPSFFTDEAGDWGDTINFANPDVRLFFLQTARLYAQTCKSDMFRFDAVHAIKDPSPVHILQEIHDDIQAIANREGRPIHIIHEHQYDRNFAQLGTPGERNVHARANWADSLNHAAKAAVAGTDLDVAYFRSFFRTAAEDVRKTGPEFRKAVAALAEAIYNGGYNIDYGDPNRKDGLKEISSQISYNPLNALLQASTHDQQGNTVEGLSAFEKILQGDAEHGLQRYKQFLTLVLLQPSVPMVWNHFARGAPFPFFHGHESQEVQDAIFEGRQEELIRAGYDRDDVMENMKDPGNAEETYNPACLYDEAGNENYPIHPEISGYIREALTYREEYIEPFIDTDNGYDPIPPQIDILDLGKGLSATWQLNGRLHAITCNFTDKPLFLKNGMVMPPYGYMVDNRETPEMYLIVKPPLALNI